jgi:hypothetical protein
MAQTWESHEDQEKDYAWTAARDKESYLHISASGGKAEEVQKLLSDKKMDKKMDVNAQWAPYHRRENEWLWKKDIHDRLGDSHAPLVWGGDSHAALVASASRVEGDTALHFAVRAGHQRVVETLLKHGARVNIKNDSEQTALDVARRHLDPEKGHMKIINLLTLHPIKQRLAFVHAMNNYNLDLDVLKKIGEMHLSLHD